jgi:hypothetical protein
VTYYTSSKYVCQHIKDHGIPDIIKIRKTFNSIKKCIRWEEKVLKKLDAKNHKQFLNHSNGPNDFHSTNKVAVKDMNGNIFFVYTNDPKFISKEYVALSKGRKYSKEINSKKACAIGKVAVKDKDNNYFQVLKTDPRYISGELIPVATGNKRTKDQNKNCGKHMVGFLLAKDLNGDTLKVKKDDPLIISGGLIPIGTNMPMAKDLNGKIFRTTRDDPRWLTGEIINPNTGKSFNKGISKPKLLCPHCDKLIAINMFNRYHGDACKLKSIFE